MTSARTCALLPLFVAACWTSKSAPSKTSNDTISNAAPADAATATAAEATARPGDTLRVTGIDPPRGDTMGGTYVMITGERFIADGPRNVKVYFGSRQGTVIRFASDTQLIVQAPGGKPNETVDVLLVFDPGGQMKLPSAFTFVDSQP
jgi:hypothetical protein